MLQITNRRVKEQWICVKNIKIKNINKTNQAKVKIEVELYHEIHIQPILHVRAAHCLAKIAYMFCSEPPVPFIESMGSVIEKIKTIVRPKPKTSLNKNI